MTHASQGATDFPGSLYPTIEQPQEHTGSFVDPTGAAVPTWVPEFLAEAKQADVLAKLCRSGRPERHVFIILPDFSTAPFGVLDALWLTTDPSSMSAPVLPSEVTHVWLTSTWDISTGLRWAPDAGWRRGDRQVRTSSAKVGSA